MVKVFLSSTFRDLKEEREALLERLSSALKAVGMECFIPGGEPSQSTALGELKKCDIVIFLISTYYGTNIEECSYPDCEAECGVKTGEEKISCTWCEYRFSVAMGKPHFTYIIDEEYWPSEDSAPIIWKLRKEIEGNELCQRIRKDEVVQKVAESLTHNIAKWYSEGKINLRNFCGRRKELRDLFEKINNGKSMEVYGVGGVGKTTLCEVVLFLYKLLGRKIAYIGSEEVHASGMGHQDSGKILSPIRHPDVTLPAIADALDLPDDIKKEIPQAQIENILSKVEGEGIILFLDNPKQSSDLKGLVERGNALVKGSIIITTKKEWGVSQFRLPLKGVEEREKLVHVMAESLGKENITEENARRIGEIAEGHPVATYVLLSNLERIGIEELESFRKGLDFSKDEDVKEYLDRVVKSALKGKVYNFLKILSTIRIAS